MRSAQTWERGPPSARAEIFITYSNIICIGICQLTVVIYLHILPEGPDYSVEDFCLKPVEKGLADTNNTETAKELQHLSK